MCLGVLLCAPLSLAAGDPANSADQYLKGSLPDHWQLTPEFSQTLPSEDAWWKSFNDSTLNTLISRAVANNYNVAAAMKRIEMARSIVKQTEAAYWPTLSASASWQRAQTGGARSDMPSSTVGSFASLGLNMNWEIDVFGRVRSQVKANKAAEGVALRDYDAVLVALCANVAKNYISLRMYQTQYDVAIAHIASQQKILKMTEARYEAGIGDMLEVTQARTVLYSTEATLPGIEALITNTSNSIAVLLGEYPDRVAPLLLKMRPLPSYSGTVAVGSPLDILRRRPDVVQAEMQLAQYAALAGVAKKDFLPALSLSGSIGTTAHKPGKLFGAHSLDYTIAPTLSWTIFDGLARNYKVAEARQQLEAGIDAYNMTVLTAVQEVDNAMNSYSASLRAVDLRKRVVAESRHALELAVDLYKQGLSSFTNVADAQMSFLENQNALVEQQGAVLTNIVTLYEALGGGF